MIRYLHTSRVESEGDPSCKSLSFISNLSNLGKSFFQWAQLSSSAPQSTFMFPIFKSVFFPSYFSPSFDISMGTPPNPTDLDGCGDVKGAVETRRRAFMGLLILEQLDLRADQQWISTAAVTLHWSVYWCHMSNACYPIVVVNTEYSGAFV